MSDQKSPNKFVGAEIIVKAFINEGVDRIFGYPGGAILPFYDALFTQNKIHHILTRHEQAAACPRHRDRERPRVRPQRAAAGGPRVRVPGRPVPQGAR